MSPLHRRFFITALAALPLAARARSGEPRVLSFSHLHTGERLELEYFSAGAYLPDALGALNHLLRDFRTGDVGAIDPALLDLLHTLRERTGTRQPFQIISGYRSPATNQMLHERSSGVATKSLHMSGQAIDIRLADVPLVRLRDTALATRAGGVGFYPGSDFVHVDTGRVRAW
jgi:uncharacterized protein YcbK (DUF882 family)